MLLSVQDDNALHCHIKAVTTLKLVMRRLLEFLSTSPGGLAFSLRWEMVAELNRKTLMSRSSLVISKTLGFESAWSMLSLWSSGCGNVTRGGDRAAKS